MPPDLFPDPTLAPLLARLAAVTGGSYRALPSGEINGPCPVCEAANGRHLYITRGRERGFVLNCFHGCGWAAIRAAAGLDQLPEHERRGRERERAMTLYDYKDEGGKLVLQVVREGRGPGKKIHQRRPDGSGGWVYRLDGIEAPLYRLPELLKAPAGSLVYLTEGEADADRLAALGLIATTSVRGTSGWSPRYCACLVGYRVAILPDHDYPGIKLANQRRNDLKAVGIEAKILDLGFPLTPDKGLDISDWLDQGHNTLELGRLWEKAGAAPRLTPPRRFQLATVEELMQRPPPDWLVGEMIERGEITVIYGLTGAGKTFLTTDLILHVTQGRPWRGRPVSAGRVLYINADGGPRFAQRIAAWRRVNGNQGADNLAVYDRAINFFDPEEAAAFIREVAEDDPKWDVIVVDTLAECMVGADEVSTKDMGLVTAALKRLKEATGAAVLVQHHATKDGLSMRGVLTIANKSSTVIALKESQGRFTVACEKQRNWPKFLPMLFSLHRVDDSAVLVELSEPLPRVVAKAMGKAELLSLIQGSPGLTRDELVEASGIEYRTLCRYVTELLAAGAVRLAATDAKSEPGEPAPKGVFPVEEA